MVKVQNGLLNRFILTFFCVSLSSKPLYGLLQAKLQLITHAYFEEKDFSQISILKVTSSVATQNTAFGVLIGTSVFLISGEVLHLCRSFSEPLEKLTMN